MNQRAKAILIFSLLFSLANAVVAEAETNVTFDLSTMKLTIPRVVVPNSNSSSCYGVSMRATPALDFSLDSATPIDCISANSAQSSQISSLIGTYDGIANGAMFSTDSTNITVSVIGTSLTITAAQFFDGTCIYSASIDSSGSSISGGTYQCSDFTTGTWTLNQIRLVDANDVYISLTSSGRGLKKMYGMKQN